ncbi:MAG TPA: PilZ domain-containing protein [Polyangiaceae bacterium]|nr:PilZ domain-containing protein [Polyangiaceae bacterium]
MSQGSHFRAHGRRPIDLRASILRPSSESVQPIRIVDLSLAGACIESSSPVVTGSWVNVEILAPSLWDPLVLRGHVVWSRPASLKSRAGLSFEHTDPSLALALFELLSAQGYSI